MEVSRFVPEFFTDPYITRATKAKTLVGFVVGSVILGVAVAATDWERLFSDPPPSYSRSASSLPSDVQKVLYLPTPQIPH